MDMGPHFSAHQVYVEHCLNPEEQVEQGYPIESWDMNPFTNQFHLVSEVG